MRSFERGERRSQERRQRWGRRALAAAGCAVVLTTGGPGAASAAPEQAPANGQSQDGVTVSAEVGFGGNVGNGEVVPVRIELTADRARTVEVTVRQGGSSNTYEVELTRDAPKVIDHVGPMRTLPTEIEVRDGRKTLASFRPERNKLPGTVVGATPGTGVTGVLDVETPGLDALISVVPIETEDLARPGAVEHLGELLMTPEDFAGLDEPTRARIGMMVWNGGDLALTGDAPSSDPLLDQPLRNGQAIVGAGSVRYVGDDIEARLGSVVRPAVGMPDVALDFDGGNIGVGGNDLSNELRFSGLIESDGVGRSGGTLAATLFGAMIIIGPVMWLLLRQLGRPQLTWFAAPAAALVIAGLLVATQSAKTQNGNPVAYRSISATPLGVSTAGLTAAGGDGATQLTGSWTPLLVDRPGVVQTNVVVPDGNSSPWVAFSAVDFVSDMQAPLTLTVTPGDGTKVNVAVTNHTEHDLVGAEVAGFARARQFGEVPAGETVTREFDTVGDVDPWSSNFAWTATDSACIWTCGEETNFYGAPQPKARLTNGMVQVSGRFVDDTDAFGSTRRSANIASATAAASGFTAGGPTGGRAAFLVQPLIGSTDNLKTLVRVTALVDFPNSSCILPDEFGLPERFDGSSWTTLQTTSVETGHYADVIPSSQFSLGNLAAGETVTLRVLGVSNFGSAPAKFLCGVAP